ncbi:MULTISPECIES: hypothetical protein [unclassified Nonomuraea]|uniref:hypothetical protein n=1 Tax=unclassified Nonomuraea TaxID=2593643 RepID=UPI003408D99F
MAIVSRIDATIAIMAALGSRWLGFPLSFSEVTRKFQHTGPSTQVVYPQAVDNFAFLVDEGVGLCRRSGRKGPDLVSDGWQVEFRSGPDSA